MMRIDGKFRSVDDAEKAFAIIKQEFIDPYEKYLILDGSDGVRQIWENKDLVSFAFPIRFGGSNGKVDVSATQHEMGHFITVPAIKSIRNGFGFGGNIPFLNSPFPSEESNFYPVGNYSAAVEAKAMAWEIILTRDLHNIELDANDIASSLKYADDFHNYEGNDEKSKIQWVTGKIIKYVDDFGTVDDFRKLWHSRCEMLPELFERERIRCGLGRQPAIFTEEIKHFFDNWNATIEQRSVAGVDDFAVTLLAEDDPGYEHVIQKSFDTYDQAKKWIGKIEKFHAPVEEDLYQPMKM